MPFTWNTVNTHASGDVLPLNDWNNAATALNAMVGTWVTTGVSNSTSTNATPPFYAWTGVTTQTSNAGAAVQMTVPNGGFPNGVIMAFAQVAYPAGLYATPYHFVFSGQYTTKTNICWGLYNASGSATVANTAVTYQFLVIGY
jgi:hypothetical protein